MTSSQLREDSTTISLSLLTSLSIFIVGLNSLSLTCRAGQSESMFVLESHLGSHPGHRGAVNTDQDVLRLDVGVDDPADIVEI